MFARRAARKRPFSLDAIVTVTMHLLGKRYAALRRLGVSTALLGIAQQRPRSNNKLIQIQAQISADCRNLMGIGPPNFM
jgi:hypothetical protein